MCHDSSRQNWHEWHKMVEYGLSLIIILSLQSFDKWIRPKKENIIDIVKKYISEHYGENVTLSEICEKYFYSVSYVSHKFKSSEGISFEQYLRQFRIKCAGEMLLSTALSVSEIAEACGYTSVRSFRKAFISITGDTPLAFRKKYNK
jgi:two-component system response regulator YesN